jgi:hypothetical protein
MKPLIPHYFFSPTQTHTYTTNKSQNRFNCQIGKSSSSSSSLTWVGFSFHDGNQKPHMEQATLVGGPRAGQATEARMQEVLAAITLNPYLSLTRKKEKNSPRAPTHPPTHLPKKVSSFSRLSRMDIMGLSFALFLC